MPEVRKWLRTRLFSICWDIGDTFMWWALNKFHDEDASGELIDVHANCEPRAVANVINLRWDNAAGRLVEGPALQHRNSSPRSVSSEEGPWLRC